jgi:hypothetical protein
MDAVSRLLCRCSLLFFLFALASAFWHRRQALGCKTQRGVVSGSRSIARLGHGGGRRQGGREVDRTERKCSTGQKGKNQETSGGRGMLYLAEGGGRNDDEVAGKAVTAGDDDDDDGDGRGRSAGSFSRADLDRGFAVRRSAMDYAIGRQAGGGSDGRRFGGKYGLRIERWLELGIERWLRC